MSGIYLTLSEAFYVLGENDLALEAAEKSYNIEVCDEYADFYQIFFCILSNKIHFSVSYVQSQSVEVRNMLLLIAPEKWQDPLRLVAPVRVMKVADLDDENVVDQSDGRTHLRLRKVVGGSPEKSTEPGIIPVVGGHWLTHKLTPNNKNFVDSQENSPVRSRAPTDTGLQTPVFSEFDIQDLYLHSAPPSVVNSKQNTPRVDDNEGEGLLSGKQSSRSKKEETTAADAGIQSARRKCVRPLRPSAAMDETTKKMIQAMLSGGEMPSVSLTTSTQDMITKRLTAQTPETHRVGDIIFEEDGDDAEEEDIAHSSSTGNQSSWLYRPTNTL